MIQHNSAPKVPTYVWPIIHNFEIIWGEAYRPTETEVDNHTNILDQSLDCHIISIMIIVDINIMNSID